MTSRLKLCPFPPVCNHVQNYSCVNVLPKLDLVFDRSIIALLLGLFRTDLLAREMSAVTLVIDILRVRTQNKTTTVTFSVHSYIPFQSANPIKYHADMFYSWVMQSLKNNWREMLHNCKLFSIPYTIVEFGT